MFRLLKTTSLLSLVTLLASASAQVGQPVTQLSSILAPVAKKGASGVYTLNGGGTLKTNEKAGVLLDATITLPTPKGKLDQAAAARIAKVVARLSALGDLEKPLTEFLVRPDVAAALPKGVQTEIANFVLMANQSPTQFTLTFALPRASGSFASTRNVQPAPKKGVIMRIYSDFECPFCLRLEKKLSTMKLPDDVSIEFHHFPLESIHPSARAAAEASECAAQQGKFWEYKDALFEKRDWIKNKNFAALAAPLGLNMGTFNKCIAARGGKANVDAGLNEAMALGLNGTPTVFVGGFKVPNPFDEAGLRNLIDLARKVDGAK